MANVRKPKVMRIVVNAFAHLDHEGRPAAAITLDPVHENPDRRFVGAVLKSELTEARTPVEFDRSRGIVRGDNRPSLEDRWFEFDSAPQTVIDLIDHGNQYYVQMARACAGELAPVVLPANKETAKRLGVVFSDPSAVVVETAKAAAARWAENHDGEVPEWAKDLPQEKMHPSHACHAKLLAAHRAQVVPAVSPKAASAVKGS
jgi:hypothetical protein